MAFTVNAQTKPTKDETLAFMNRVLLSAHGTVYEEMYNYAITESNITYNKYTYQEENIIKDPDLHVGTEYEYSILKWEDLNTNTTQEGDASNGLYEFRAFFNSNVKLKEVTKYFVDGSQTEKTTYVDRVVFVLPKDKLESFRKACLRLSEIAKEENKDPFSN